MELKITFTLSDRVVFLHEICLPLGSKWTKEGKQREQMALGRYIVSSILDEKPEYCIQIPKYDWNLIKMAIYKYINITSIR